MPFVIQDKEIVFNIASFSYIFLQKSSVLLVKAVAFRKAYLIFGLIALLVALPIIIFILREPKDNTERVIYSSTTEEKSSDETNWGKFMENCL